MENIVSGTTRLSSKDRFVGSANFMVNSIVSYHLEEQPVAVLIVIRANH